MSDLTRRRPWLAVLLAMVVSGLGHAYLRRWGRAFGWYVAITATLVLLVPDAAIDQLWARQAPPLTDVAPALVVIVASIVDAYLVAVRNNRAYEKQQHTGVAGGTGGDTTGGRTGGFDGGDGPGRTPATSDSASDPSGPGETDPTDSRSEPTHAATEGVKSDEPPIIECPHCGRETDADIDFCHWCTEPLVDEESG